jgi:solute carrier family 25 phosphate transporter 3
MTSRDKAGCPTATLPLDRLLASLAANVEQLGKRWEIAVCDRRAKETRRKAEMAPAVELHTPLFYATCALGGVLSTGLTHLAVTPLDLVKCNMQVSDSCLLCPDYFLLTTNIQWNCFHQCQVDPNKYRDISSGFGVLLQEQGLGGFFKGWMATLVGYSSQGACKFGFYEYFKKCYSDIAGPENADRLKTVIYLAASASAEVIADIALCPMEAVKVRIQTQPGFARCLTDGLPKLVQSEGAFGYRYYISSIDCYCVKISSI